MKTFVMATVDKKMFVVNFNSVHAESLEQARGLVEKLNNSDNFVYVVAPSCIKNIIHTFNKASDWKF